MLSVRQLVKKYSSQPSATSPAVNDITFEVRPGECFGLLGPNGAGKSTTIHCITGFYPPTSGEVFIGEHNVHQNPKSARQILGVCPQDDTLDTDFSVLDQMVRHAAFFRISEKEGLKRSEELLKRFGLLDRAHDLVETLSGGMRRRLQVARALVSSPRLLVLDEPTTGLDPEVRRTLWEIIGDCRKQGMGILLCTHYMEEAERLCDRVAIIHRGKILDIRPPDELIRKYISNSMLEEEIRPGVKWKRPPNLEDVYLKLTGDRLGVLS